MNATTTEQMESEVRSMVSSKKITFRREPFVEPDCIKVTLGHEIIHVRITTLLLAIKLLAKEET